MSTKMVFQGTDGEVMGTVLITCYFTIRTDQTSS